MEIFALASTVLVFIVLLRSNVGSSKRADAALNILLAKHTFSQLSIEDRNRVESRTHEILTERGFDLHFQNDIERYGWYALALSDLGIAHQATGLNGWKAISNPSKAIAAGDPLLQTAAFLLKKKYSINVSVR